MTVSGYHEAVDARRKNNLKKNPDLNWSSKGERLTTTRWAKQSLERGQKVYLAVFDVSDVQYSPFISIDKRLAARILANPDSLPEVMDERRFLELRHLNLAIAGVQEDFREIEEIFCAYDNSNYRREAKNFVGDARHTRAAQQDINRRVREAIVTYRKEQLLYQKEQKKQQTGKKPSPPQIDMDEDGWIKFPAFAPPTDEELLPSSNKTPIQQQIHQEAVLLVASSYQLVSLSEADSVCRNASMGLYRDYDSNISSDYPLADFRPVSNPPPPPPPNSITKRASLILGKDSDHHLLNDGTSTQLILGTSRNYDCRAVNLRKRQDHPSDWKYKDRFAQTFAMSLIGCDESRGLPGFRVATVAQASSLDGTQTPKQRHDRELLDFINRYKEVLKLYEKLHNTKEVCETNLLSEKKKERSVSWVQLEQDFKAFIGKVLGTGVEVPSSATLENTVQVYLGLVEEKGTVKDQEELRKSIQQPMVDSINNVLRSLYTSPNLHNHSYSSLVPSRPTNPPPKQAKPRRPYTVRPGPNSRSLLEDQRKESEALVRAQQPSAAQPQEGKLKKGKSKEETSQKGKSKKGKSKVVAGEDVGEDEGDEKKSKRVGVGLKELNLAMSTVSFPFRVESIKNLQFPDIPDQHKFHYDFIATLGSILRLWHSECPAIVETVSSLLDFYSEFAPTFLIKWASNPQAFGDRVATLVLALRRYYDRYPLSDDLPRQNSELLALDALTSAFFNFEQYVPRSRVDAFRQRVLAMRFTEEELQVLNVDITSESLQDRRVDLAMAVIIKERRKHKFPPLLLKSQDFVALNFTTCGTGYMNASDSRSKVLPSFLAKNLLLTFQRLPERIASNPYSIPTNKVSTALDVLQALDQKAVSAISPSVNSPKVLRLLKLRIQTAPLPRSTEVPLTSRPVTDDDEQDEAPHGEDKETFMLGEPAEVEDEEEMAEFGNDDEPPFDEEEQHAIGTPELFKDKLIQEIVAVAARNSSTGGSEEIRVVVHALVELLNATLDFSLDFVKHSFLAAIGILSEKERKNWKEFETIGDLVVAVGGKLIKFQKTERFLIERKDDGEAEQSENENEAEEEGKDENDEEDVGKTRGASKAEKVARQVIVELLPILEKPHFRFKPRGCATNVEQIYQFTNPSRQDNYLPDLIFELLQRIAGESRQFNLLWNDSTNNTKNVNIEDFKLPTQDEIDQLPVESPKRHAYEKLIRLATSNPFIEDQLAHPGKLLSWLTDHWPLLSLEEQPSNGPLVVRSPTEETYQQLRKQSQTVHAIFKQLKFTQVEADQGSFEVLNWIFRPSIGVRFFHGQIWFDGFSINALVLDPRKFTILGKMKHEDKVKALPWSEGIEKLVSMHPKLPGVYKKIEAAQARLRTSTGNTEAELVESLSEPKVPVQYSEDQPRRPKDPQYRQVPTLTPLPPVFESVTTGGVTSLKYRIPPQSSNPITLDDRSGILLPFKEPLSEYGVNALAKVSEWVSTRMYNNEGDPPVRSAVEAVSSNRLDPPPFLPSPSPPPPHAQSAAIAHPPASTTHLPAAIASSSASSRQPSSSGQVSLPSAAAPPTSSILGPHSPPLTIPPVAFASSSSSLSQPASSMAPSGQSSLPVSASALSISQQGGGGGEESEQESRKTEKENEMPPLGIMVSIDEGRNVLVDAAIIYGKVYGDEKKTELVRIPSGPLIRRQKRAQGRLETLTPFETRSRLAHALKPISEVNTTDLSVLLRRKREQDPTNPAKLLPIKRYPFESLSLFPAPPLQPGLVHTPGYLHSFENYKTKEKERDRLKREARQRWNSLIPKPEGGRKVDVLFVLPYGHISGGKGYGKQASRGVVDAELQALRSMKWIRLILLRSVEGNTFKVCSKPGCGGSLVYPCRLLDGSDIYRLVVCILCFRVSHRDDNAAINTARIVLARAQGVSGNVLSPDNARLLEYNFRGTNAEVKKLKNALNAALVHLSEEERRIKLESLKIGDSLFDYIRLLAQPEAAELEELEEIEDVDRRTEGQDGAGSEDEED